MKKEIKKTYRVLMENGDELPRLTEAYIKSEFYKDNDFKHMSPMGKGGLVDMFNDNAYFMNWIAEAQQEVDVTWYKDRIRGIFEALENGEATPNCTCGCWQSLKDKFLK